MSLVAYGSSDEDSENEQNESIETIVVTNDINNDTMQTVNIPASSKLSLPAPKTISQSANDEEEENGKSDDFKHFLDILPKPKISDSVENIEEDDDILLKKETEYQAAKPVKKQTVKISVPSLSQFKDLEEENDKKPAKIIQPSQKGCGLFAILVPPKEKTANNKILIPQTVKNVAMKTNIQQSKSTTKKSSKNQMNDSKIRKPSLDKLNNELSSDDEEDEEVDFFGLTASKNLPGNSVSGLLNLELPLDNLQIKEETLLIKDIDHSIQNSSSISSDILPSNQSNNSSKTLISNVINLPKEEILLKNKAEVGPKLPVPEQEYNVDTEGNVAFDEKAIEYLCGKRGIKRKDREINETNIIEINGEDIKPDEREWLVKALTEEPVQRPVSMQSCGINSQSKKKHQITYLAHQAKAMELELKNQWSQNRMTRKQTKSKYGF